MDFTTTLGDIKQTVDQELLHFFSEKRREAEKIHPQTIQLVDAIADLTSRGGKRTRAFLAWLGHEAVIPANAGIQSTKNWIPDQVGDDNLRRAMMGIELFQSFALIHDDIIDQDTIRRGAPTVHEHFRTDALACLPIHPSTHSPITARIANRFGESMAILAGDLALVWADELMAASICHSGSRAGIQAFSCWIPGQARDDNCAKLVDISNIYQKMKEEVILGQGLDVLAANGLPSADRATINRYKTAWYSVVRPLQIGASIAGADEKTIEALVPYGLAVGEGYQLRDDFLDGEISQEEFDTQSEACQKQTFHAAAEIHASAGAVSLFIDFARFALIREK